MDGVSEGGMWFSYLLAYTLTDIDGRCLVTSKHLQDGGKKLPGLNGARSYQPASLQRLEEGKDSNTDCDVEKFTSLIVPKSQCARNQQKKVRNSTYAFPI